MTNDQSARKRAHGLGCKAVMVDSAAGVYQLRDPEGKSHVFGTKADFDSYLDSITPVVGPEDPKPVVTGGFGISSRHRVRVFGIRGSALKHGRK